MNTRTQSLGRALLGVALLVLPLNAPAQSNPSVTRDGQHDFDWEIGSWKTHLRRLKGALTGSGTWVEYEGTSMVTKILNGRANLVELDVDGPAGRIEGLSLRPPLTPTPRVSSRRSRTTGGRPGR